MNSTTNNTTSGGARRTLASTSSSPRDALKHGIELDNNDEQQVAKRTRREEVSITPPRKSADHSPRKVQGKSKPLLFTTSRVESSTSHTSVGLSNDPRGHPSPLTATDDHHMAGLVSQDTTPTGSQDISKKQYYGRLKQLLQQKDAEIMSLKIKLEVREEFDLENIAREEELKDTIEKHRSDAEYWKERSSCGLESYSILQEKYKVLEIKLETATTELQVKYKKLEAEHEAVKVEFEEQCTVVAIQETELAELQVTYDTLEAKYKTLKATDVNQASYVLYDGRKSPEFISVNPENPFFTEEELAAKRQELADQNAAELQQALDDLCNNVVKDCDVPVQSIEVVPEDMRWSEVPEETSEAGSRSSSPKRTGSSVPLRYATPSVTTKSPDPPNTYESNLRLWATPDRPLFPDPPEESP
ncbi:uncharacterized protein EAF01_010188 [Botrytis porri]|uniref:Uncharacterized protein n=1 Tax=Botrytis porri TaxID=87229 RepID=A0A4Z1KKC4_9HELO|nr:uncharacterized protein EAF01_010188 [Botrytis porri]KAF7894738.1 hypothetical protein EAF01_010188 [Botrytis porri]TGO85930.1 hypothetical protein BPOR_0351g00130 [Botrytis porri]